METSFELSTVPLAGTCSGTTAYPLFSKLIERTTYKPYTRLFFRQYNEGLINGKSLFGDRVPPIARLTLKIWTQDSRNPRLEPKLLEFTSVVTPMIEEYDDEYRKIYLRHFLESYEEHEIDEWFQVDGKLVNDPHAKEGQGKNAR